eukprot:UN10415
MFKRRRRICIIQVNDQGQRDNNKYLSILVIYHIATPLLHFEFCFYVSCFTILIGCSCDIPYQAAR